MMRARLQDAAEIWRGHHSHFGPLFSWLRIKATICMALGWESFSSDTYDSHVPVWASSQSVSWGWDGPQCSWREVAVATSWKKWTFTSYVNGYG